MQGTDKVNDLDKTDAYAFSLPAVLIAQEPVRPRDASRLLVLDGPELVHRRFTDIAEYFTAGDVLVLNEARVLHARVFGQRQAGGGHVELLFLHPAGGLRFDAQAAEWRVLVRPGRKAKPGMTIRFDATAAAEVLAEEEDGARIMRLHGISIEELFARHGVVPLPPYVTVPPVDAAETYQTIFARVPGSVAAPTASLHFTPGVFDALRERGVEIVRLVLDVGLGTFRPISAARISDHRMHSERYEIPPESAEAIVAARRRGGRVTAAGTTVLRALESAANADGTLRAGARETALYVTPGYEFRVVDRLLTNFHLPRSTLLVLVCAFAGYEATLRAYHAAVDARYRFFSYGDAMLVTRAGG